MVACITRQQVASRLLCSHLSSHPTFWECNKTSQPMCRQRMILWRKNDAPKSAHIR